MDKLPFFVQLGVGLGDGVLVLFVGREIDNLVGRHGPDLDLGQLLEKAGQAVGHRLVDPLVGRGNHFTRSRIDDLLLDGLAQGAIWPVGDAEDHLAVWRFNKAVLVDPAIGGQGADQADVWAFRRFDRADAAIVGVVHVAHVEAGPLAPQATGPQGAQAPLVGQLVQRVGLLHELRELAAAKELARCRHHRPDVDERDGRHLLRLADAHPLAHYTLHAQQADAELVLDQLAHRLDAAVAQVVDVVRSLDPVVDLDYPLHDPDQVLIGQDALIQRDVQVQVLVQLVASHLDPGRSDGA